MGRIHRDASCVLLGEADPGPLARRVDLERQRLAGSQELHQEGEARAERLVDAVAQHPDRVFLNCLLECAAIVQARRVGGVGTEPHLGHGGV